MRSTQEVHQEDHVNNNLSELDHVVNGTKKGGTNYKRGPNVGLLEREIDQLRRSSTLALFLD